VTASAMPDRSTGTRRARPHPRIAIFARFLIGAEPSEWAASPEAAPANREATRPQGATLTRRPPDPAAAPSRT
jgi:hypothetical protein